MPEAAWGSAVLCGQARVGQDRSDASGADRAAPVGQGRGDRIPRASGLEPRAAEEGLHLRGALRRRVWAWPWGEEVGWRAVEDGVADSVRGCACLEAEAGSAVARGEAAECPERAPTDLLLDGVCLGARDGLPRTVSAHARALVRLNGEAKSERHGRPLPRGGLDASRALPIGRRHVCQNHEPSPGEHGQTNAAGFAGYTCRYGRELKHMERHCTAWAIIP